MSINDDIWDQPSTMGEGSLKDDWTKAVKYLADHIEANDMNGHDRAEDLAQSFLLETFANMSARNPGATTSDIISHISHTYIESQDIGWTMSVHSLLKYKLS